jgi:hypothetical protein
MKTLFLILSGWKTLHCTDFEKLYNNKIVCKRKIKITNNDKSIFLKSIQRIIRGNISFSCFKPAFQMIIHHKICLRKNHAFCHSKCAFGTAHYLLKA